MPFVSGMLPCPPTITEFMVASLVPIGPSYQSPVMRYPESVMTCQRYVIY
jgi:hypothetical protein